VTREGGVSAGLPDRTSLVCVRSASIVKSLVIRLVTAALIVGIERGRITCAGAIDSITAPTSSVVTLQLIDVSAEVTSHGQRITSTR